MDVPANLGTGADSDVTVHHRTFSHVRSYVHIGRRHDDAAGSQVRAAPDAGAAGDDAYAVGGIELPHREGIFVKEGELPFAHVCNGAQLEAGQDNFFYVPIYHPLAVHFPGNAELAFFQCGDNFVKFLQGNFH